MKKLGPATQSPAVESDDTIPPTSPEVLVTAPAGMAASPSSSPATAFPSDLVQPPQAGTSPFTTGSPWSFPPTGRFDPPTVAHGSLGVGIAAELPSAAPQPAADAIVDFGAKLDKLVETMMVCFAQQNAAAAAATASATASAAAASTAIRSVPVPTLRTEEYLRTFGGEPEEEPEDFIAEVEAYFTEVGALNHRHQVLVAHRQLRGVAARQNKYYTASDARVADLWRRLRASFGTEAKFAELLAKFTASSYNRRDPLEVYIDKQQRLYRRLFPNSSDERVVDELIKQMPASIRATLAVGKYGSLDEFGRTAQRVLSLSADGERKKSTENWRRAVETSPPQPDASA